MDRKRIWPGLLLIGIGVFLLLGQWFEYSGPAVLGAMAVFFFLMYAGSRAYGLLIPGFILGGLAIGVGLEESGVEKNGGAVVLGLAAAFIAIYVANVVLARPAHWWPLIPGTILGTVGGSLVLSGTQAGAALTQLWPVALIVVGALLLLVRREATATRL